MSAIKDDNPTPQPQGLNRGRPQHFIPSFRRKHGNDNKPTSSMDKAKSAEAPETRAPKQKNLPGPKPAPKEEQIFRDSIFGTELSGVEDNTRLFFNTNHSNLISLSDMIFDSYVSRESNFDRKLLIEALRYYACALFWLRVIDIKAKTSQPLTPSERQLFDMFDAVEFNIPEPMYLYFKAMGQVVEVTGEHLLPSYPQLPTEVVAGFGGLFNAGAVAADTHNLYEEYPSMGIAAENLRHALGNQADGTYDTIVAPVGTTANENLLGFKPLSYRRPEAKARFQTCGITPLVIHEDVPHTAFNYAALQVVSSTLATTSVFKINTTKIGALGSIGSVAQTVMSQPVMTTALTRCSEGEIVCTSLTMCTNAIYGIANSFGYQVWKNDAIGAQPARELATTWCCINFTDVEDLPQGWVDNRNVRRNIPVRYTDAVFKTVALNSWQYRRRIVTSFEKEG